MHQTLKIILATLCISVLWITGCAPAGGGKKGLGLVETPEMLYKSFREAAPKGNAGPAPALAGDVDLSPLFPKPGDQGQIGSCTAWSTAYACKSYQENLEREWGTEDKSHMFSPSFIYNQINGGVDYGAPLELAISVVISLGCATLDTMPYTENYRQAPLQAAFNEAVQYKAKSFARVDSKNLEAVKAKLAEGHPVLIGMMVYENIYNYKSGIYKEAAGDSLGGHAMCVMGYDDAKGAFKIINSWGTWWGEQGYLWLDYELFKRDVVTCLVMYDEVISRPQVAAPPVNVEASQGAAAAQIKVTWEAAANAVSYLVSRSDNPSEYFKEIANTRGTTYLDKDVKPGKIYYYAVKSVGSAGTSDFSESAGGYAGSLEDEIGVPQDLRGVFSDNRVYLKWNTVQGAGGYYVYRFDKETENYLRAGETLDTSYRDSGTFKDKDVIWYIVTAYKGSRESKACTPVSVTAGITVKQLKPPRNVKATRGTYKDKIDVAWKAVEGAESYKFYKWYVKEEKWKFITELRELAYSDTEPGTEEAFYIVTAMNPYAVSGPSEPAWGWIYGYKNKAARNKYDDDSYYNDTDYFGDTDYKDENKYKDDKHPAENAKKETYTDFTDNTLKDNSKGKDKDKNKDADRNRDKADTKAEKEKLERQKEREADDKFLKDDSREGESGKVLEKVRPRVDKTEDKTGTGSGLRDKVSSEMSKDDEEFFADNEDDNFFADMNDEDF